MKKVTIITGHYGSGKTNISVNLAIDLAKKGEKVTVVDLDFVNPYFRTADFAELFKENRIKLVSSNFANTNIDIPAVSFDLDSLVNQPGYVIIDVGGDDDGATALGRYKDVFDKLAQNNQLDMYMIINKYRHLTKTADDTIPYMKAIEMTSRLMHTGIINNSNLGFETTAKIAMDSLNYANEISKLTDIPIVFNSIPENTNLLKNNDNDFRKIKVYVKPIWEQ